MKSIFYLLIFSCSFGGLAQNLIELKPADCNNDKTFGAFMWDGSKTKLLTGQNFADTLNQNPPNRLIINNRDTLTIRYQTIYGQIIDTTILGAKKLNMISICITKINCPKKSSYLQQAIDNKLEWTLSTSLFDSENETEKLILIPSNRFLKYKLIRDTRIIKRGRIKITDQVLKQIGLFENKISLVNRNAANFQDGYFYKINIGNSEVISSNNGTWFRISYRGLLNSIGISE